MDLVKDNIHRVFGKYLVTSLGSSVVMSLYAFVDAVVIGQAEGPDGAAAAAVFAPLIGILMFIGGMIGLGGAVLMSNAVGAGDKEEGNRWFTASCLSMGAVTLILWALMALLRDPLLYLFGATGEIMPLAISYANWIIRLLPLMLSSIFLAGFIRNDGDPQLAMGAVIGCALLNIAGDYLLVFPAGLGIAGAAIATAACSGIQTLILCIHFVSGKNTLRFVKVTGILKRGGEICSVGFSAGMVDLANVVLFSLLNHQVTRYGNVTYLAVFGAMESLATLLQSLMGGIGQALQPIVSVNFGAGEEKRCRSVLKDASAAAMVFGIGALLVCFLLPRELVSVFMAATPEVLAVAGEVVRPYALVFPFMALNVTGIYYFQSTLKAGISTLTALLRGLILSGLLSLLLPLLAGITGLWFAVPLAEAVTAAVTVILLSGKAGTRRETRDPE